MGFWKDLAKAALSVINKRDKPMFGIDVSKNNGMVSWGAVALNSTKVDFAFIKATEGTTVFDKKFLLNVSGCQKNGIKWSAYHFATWNNHLDIVGDAKAEAKWFLNCFTDACKPDLPLVLDVETNKPIPYSKQEVLLYINTFVGEVEKAGYECALYSSTGFLDSYLPANHGLGRLKLWLANYNKVPKIPQGWTKYWVWQYTDQGKINGVATNCDLNKTEQAIY